ncbi:thiamine pyrophosphate-dependent enzyme [Arcticibacterium luteifluviistationis]|uniref:3-methyl-2-oxobutanoate dehydrogenase (2-methylpropanoyl-transferring) n=1 Tax=Arcticibacterium luteifluviistationis TaxID=1784714 RepID=A0A2Z4GI92_9BACT|nr:thiamine pyrophosphate-dependent enzyme [Arcticibacterium luteifluviistationis]AWW00972.1 transketolase [Arcticibacterium luteifluviistationis]
MSDTSSQASISSKFIIDKKEVLEDYRLAVESREVSLLGRKEVFMGRAKFGIFGDGKELAQLAMAKVFRKGDFRSGYYRDQTFVAAVGGMTWTQFYSQLYAHADHAHDIFSAGRSMNGHFSNSWLDDKGKWLKQTELYNQVMDVSPTAGQIPRSIGIGYASKLYRNNPELKDLDGFSNNGNEVCFATIGDASTSQGMFFESINAAGVLQIPVIFAIWDDGYGISVPSEYQTTKSSISKALAGFQANEDGPGLEIIKARGWNYPELVEAFQKAARFARDKHMPCLLHVYEVTQPQGHSSSGSHERYKSKDRLAWETGMDCNVKFKEWILKEGVASESELTKIEADAKEVAKKSRQDAWQSFRKNIDRDVKEAISLLDSVAKKSSKKNALNAIRKSLVSKQNPLKRDAVSAIKKAKRTLIKENVGKEFAPFLDRLAKENLHNYSSHLYSEFESSPLNVKEVKAKYGGEQKVESGHQIINKYFDLLLAKDKRVFALGEDVGSIGDVNQGFAGLQEKFGKLRVEDTGIREATIIGQGIGAAMRGLRPIVEVQYFDYIYYCLSILTDDLACLRYRTFGRQMAPVIIRTRGHRLEGIWHSGSPLAVMIHSLRGMHICVPRNFVQAAGLYNTLLAGDDPALMIEPLNGYRLKEKSPSNLGEICVPLGEPEILKKGTDITIVTYGSMCNIVMAASEELEKVGISMEVIDVQTLLPFDRTDTILESLQRTNRIIFADEDMPGGASAYMMQHVIELKGGYKYLDSKATTISAKQHRPAYGSDGDYFSKPNEDDIFDVAYSIMREAKPKSYPEI